ncbi:MAG TPA: 3-oxoacyl-[acyl-carrier-protein] synthase III C-terminal domain-containing protein [Herpetosiphonaceae bacterium]
MARIQSIATAVPAYEVPQAAVQQRVREHFAPAFPNIDHYLPVFRHAQIDTRFMVRPLEWWDEQRTFGQCNQVFVEEALVLGRQAIERCLAPRGLSPQDIDHLLVVTTTGLAAPSLDALLIHELGMGRHTRRTPIWGLGCAGGIGGLARAAEYVRAEPTHRALLLNVEFCSLTYLAADLSKRNLIATSLFSDGVAAVLVEGAEVAPAGERPAPVRVVDTLSTLYPGTPEIMGWNIVDGGFEVVFSSRIPGIVRDQFPPLLREFLGRHGLEQGDIGRYLLHPGGAKVIGAYQEALGLDPAQLAVSRSVLRRYGNMSSATVFFVMEEALREQPLAPGEYGILAVFGPGFSAELALVRGE